MKKKALEKYSSTRRVLRDEISLPRRSLLYRQAAEKGKMAKISLRISYSKSWFY